jgi:hypothetical protein
VASGSLGAVAVIAPVTAAVSPDAMCIASVAKTGSRVGMEAEDLAVEHHGLLRWLSACVKACVPAFAGDASLQVTGFASGWRVAPW